LSDLNASLLSKALNPVVLAAWAFANFLIIHPFTDGNGRFARILINYILSKYMFPFKITLTECPASKRNYNAMFKSGKAEPLLVCRLLHSKIGAFSFV
jgi:Fic family protein